MILLYACATSINYWQIHFNQALSLYSACGTITKNTCHKEYYLCGKLYSFMKKCTMLPGLGRYTIISCDYILQYEVEFRWSRMQPIEFEAVGFYNSRALKLMRQPFRILYKYLPVGLVIPQNLLLVNVWICIPLSSFVSPLTVQGINSWQRHMASYLPCCIQCLRRSSSLMLIISMSISSVAEMHRQSTMYFVQAYWSTLTACSLLCLC